VIPDITTRALEERTRAELDRLLPATYRYFKSYHHFREGFEDGVAYLTINTVTHGRGVYNLAFYLGTRVDSLQDRVSAVLGEPRRMSHDSRSISCYSVNIGPQSPHWPFPFWAHWSLERMSDFESHVEELQRFIVELALPFLEEHRTAEAVRKTLLDHPGHSINLEPYKQILVASAMNGDRDRLIHDIRQLEARYAGHVATYRQEFELVRDKVLHSICGSDRPGR
jgi:hypothetical protein